MNRPPPLEAAASTIAFNALLVRAARLIGCRRHLVMAINYDDLTADAKASAHALRRHFYKDLKEVQRQIGERPNVLRPSNETLKLLEDALRKGALE
jgi:hypothetical protein